MMFLARCLKLADENGRLRIENANLRRNLAMTSQTLRKAVDERDQARRDVDLLVLCAKDRRAAAEMVQTRPRHRRVGGGMMGTNSEARKSLESQPAWPRLALVDDVRIAAAEVWHGAETCDAEALLDQLETRGLKVVRA